LNMIPSNMSEAWAAGLVEPSVFYFNGSIQQYLYMMEDDDMLVPGMGYWIYSYENCLLTRNP